MTLRYKPQSQPQPMTSLKDLKQMAKPRRAVVASPSSGRTKSLTGGKEYGLEREK